MVARGAQLDPHPKLAGRRVLVLGAARSGRAAALLLAEHGAEVLLADRDSGALPGEARMRLGECGIRFALGREDLDLLSGCDLVVVSPGVPVDHPLVRAAEASGIGVAGELELASSFARAPLVAVTGTDGKSTTVTLLGALLAAAGRRAPVAGNVGRPLADAVDEAGPGDLLVIEVSSFQLETVHTLKPQVAVLLNLAPDHLDRHHSLDVYRELKLKLFARQRPEDDAVLPAGWGEVPGAGRRLAFGLDPELVTLGATVVNGWLVRRSEAGEEQLLPAAELGLPGPHNLENALAAVAALSRYAIPAPVLAEALRRFRGLPHRLEEVAVVSGVAYVNDSKATNVHALSSALRTFPRGIHLIAGGRDKASDFAALAGLIAERVVRVYRIGEARERLHAAWPAVAGGDYPSLAAAVTDAAARARAGEVVLLAPGCASFDMFRDFEDRGETFRRLVHALGKEAR
jgi:UDP-N-acetylmuramoylalanine--D-glutamate ligase